MLQSVKFTTPAFYSKRGFLHTGSVGAPVCWRAASLIGAHVSLSTSVLWLKSAQCVMERNYWIQVTYNQLSVNIVLREMLLQCVCLKHVRGCTHATVVGQTWTYSNFIEGKSKILSPPASPSRACRPCEQAFLIPATLYLHLHIMTEESCRYSLQNSPHLQNSKLKPTLEIICNYL